MNNLRLEPGSVILTPDEVERLYALVADVQAALDIDTGAYRRKMARLGVEIRDILAQGQEL